MRKKVLLKKNLTDIDKLIRDKNITYIQTRYRGFNSKKKLEKLKIDRAVKVLRIVRYLRKYVKRKKIERADLKRIPSEHTLNKIKAENLAFEKAASKIQIQWRDFNSNKKVIRYNIGV